jgi:hypothetical protein
MGTCGSDETVVFSQPPSPIARAVSCLVESKSMGADEWSHFRSVLAFNNCAPLCIQNPDTPAEKPKLQSYKIDLNQCGPMLLDALVSGISIPAALSCIALRH